MWSGRIPGRALSASGMRSRSFVTKLHQIVHRGLYLRPYLLSAAEVVVPFASSQPQVQSVESGSSVSLPGVSRMGSGRIPGRGLVVVKRWDTAPRQFCGGPKDLHPLQVWGQARGPRPGGQVGQGRGPNPGGQVGQGRGPNPGGQVGQGTWSVGPPPICEVRGRVPAVVPELVNHWILKYLGLGQIGGGEMAGHRPSTSGWWAEGPPPSCEVRGRVPAVAPRSCKSLES
jgi:hypothetical protein